MRAFASRSREADHGAVKTPGFPDILKALARHLEVAGDGDRFSDRPRRAETSQRPARTAKNPLHAGVRHGDDIGKLPHQAELDHAGEEFVRRACDAAGRLRLSGAEVDAETAAFQIAPDAGAAWPSRSAGNVSRSMLGPVVGKSRTQP